MRVVKYRILQNYLTYNFELNLLKTNTKNQSCYYQCLGSTENYCSFVLVCTYL